MRPARLDLFVYGSLRPGGALFEGWFEDSFIDSKRACADGAMYSVGAYPVVFFDQPGTVIGDVVTVQVTPTVIRCMEMETAAGYALVDIDCWLMQNGVRTNSSVRAYAFHCAGGYQLQERVHSGNWFTFDATHPHRRGEGTLQ